jgi:Tol biopolymer transport system component
VNTLQETDLKSQYNLNFNGLYRVEAVSPSGTKILLTKRVINFMGMDRTIALYLLDLTKRQLTSLQTYYMARDVGTKFAWLPNEKGFLFSTKQFNLRTNWLGAGYLHYYSIDKNRDIQLANAPFDYVFVLLSQNYNKDIYANRD